MEKPLRIGITDCGKYENYRKWIESVPGVETIRLSAHLQNARLASECDGILFSGVEDLQPALYGKPEYELEYELKEIIPERDRFEYEVMEKALAGKKPVLGICRGLQLVNVYLGGTLVPDIPAVKHSNLHGKTGGKDQSHPVRVEPGSQIREITGQDAGMVNSAHHQSADLPAPDLKVTAYSDPAVVEAMEWKEPKGRNWMQLVQWHPERMTDLTSPFSQKLREAFIRASLEART